MRSLPPAIALSAITLLAACAESPTRPAAQEFDTDYAVVTFGTPAAALEGTLGPQRGQPFDGRTATARLPDSLALTDAQKARIEALRSAFVAANQAALDQLAATFERARAAKESGASRDEVRAILESARPTAESLRAQVLILYAAVQAILTPAQRAWLEANKPARPRGP